MSNQVTIQPTKFEDVRTGDVTYGFRAYDDYGQSYGNTMDSISDDDLEFLREVCEKYYSVLGDQYLVSLLDSVVEMEKGLYIGDTYYEYAQIGAILDNSEEDEVP